MPTKNVKHNLKPNNSNHIKGRFVRGNNAAVGRADKPIDQKAKRLKEAYINAITEKDIKAIVAGQVKKAKEGDTAAAKEVFDRLWGRAKQEIDVEHSGSISFTEALSKATKGEEDV